MAVSTTIRRALNLLWFQHCESVLRYVRQYLTKAACLAESGIEIGTPTPESLTNAKILS